MLRNIYRKKLKSLLKNRVSNNFNLIIMSNLNDFKVEELEQRLEMRKWELSLSGSKDGLKGSAKLTF